MSRGTISQTLVHALSLFYLKIATIPHCRHFLFPITEFNTEHMHFITPIDRDNHQSNPQTDKTNNRHGQHRINIREFKLRILVSHWLPDPYSSELVFGCPLGFSTSDQNQHIAHRPRTDWDLR
jgi:hypothetical protein